MPGQHRRQPLDDTEHRLRDAIQRAREARGVSARALSAKMGWHEATIGKIERGERAITVAELIGLGHALDASPIHLLREAMGDHEAEPVNDADASS